MVTQSLFTSLSSHNTLCTLYSPFYYWPWNLTVFRAVLRIRIRIHRIHIFLGLLDPDPDPLVRGMDPDPNPSVIKQI
jgi:hypothetical protein